ncbi:MAG: trypsin-like peptidase domain-containing protein, partial [Gammaproteobacteria bacterium]
MANFGKILQFIGWPTICGILVAVIAVQFQQLQMLEQRIDSLDTTELAEPAREPTFAEAIARASSSVVGISAARLGVESVERTSDNQIDFYLEERESLGSGIIISNKGFILTNHHVVDNFFDAFDTEVTVGDGRRIPATVVAWDEINDLAVLHINLDDLTPITIGNEKELQVGDFLF